MSTVFVRQLQSTRSAHHWSQGKSLYLSWRNKVYMFNSFKRSHITMELPIHYKWEREFEAFVCTLIHQRARHQTNASNCRVRVEYQPWWMNIDTRHLKRESCTSHQARKMISQARILWDEPDSTHFHGDRIQMIKIRGAVNVHRNIPLALDCRSEQHWHWLEWHSLWDKYATEQALRRWYTLQLGEVKRTVIRVAIGCFQQKSITVDEN